MSHINDLRGIEQNIEISIWGFLLTFLTGLVTILTPHWVLGIALLILANNFYTSVRYWSTKYYLVKWMKGGKNGRNRKERRSR